MTKLTRWDPFDLSGLHMFDDRFEDWMRRMFHPLRARGAEEALDIAIDVTEKNNAYLIKASIPGARKEDINVAVDGNLVSISAEVKKEKEEKEGEKVLRRECCYGGMQRSFTLPGDVEQGKVDAKYVNGVLELTLPKKAGGTARKIEIQ
ncbi:MAG TPA: Hsp20/alpha crystallin family protein [Gammaproteobacteria bacterium]|nr:Hsp20/alpha crystallin family protein [Gammaproteobacteria bacterium]